MINKLKEYKNIILSLIKLSLPILGGNVSHILIGFADNIVAGQYSTVALGAISVASAIVMTVTIAAIGLILGISPVIANFRGENICCKKFFKLSLLFALVVSVPFFLILEILLAKIGFLGLSAELVEPTRQYIEICAWSIFPAAIFVAAKEFLQAYEKVVFANLTMLLSVILNIILNIILTFGFDFSFIHIEAMGIVGLSIATLVSKIFTAVLILIYCLPLFKGVFVYSKKYIQTLFKVGTPISLAIFFEFLGFNMTAILIGKFSALLTAVHNIILCIANFTFMIVLSVANAASIKIGYFNGKKDKLNIIKYAKANIFLAIVVCFATFSLLIFFSDGIISIFSPDKEVLQLSKKILKIAMCFLFFDGIQGACVGILKGLKDTKIIMFATLFGYVCVAIPLGCYLAFCKNIILEGFWIGLALALFLMAVITSSKVILKIKQMKD